MGKSEKFNLLINRVKEIGFESNPIDTKLYNICKLLADNVNYYNWVGFYLVDQTKQRELVLGPFVGEPTEHTRIPFGRGICGQAAEGEKDIRRQDIFGTGM